MKKIERYLDYSSRDDVLSGGVKMISVNTPKGTFRVWTKRVGNNPRHMEKMADHVRRGRYLFCPNGSHMAMYDDQITYFEGLIKFIDDVDQDGFD